MNHLAKLVAIALALLFLASCGGIEEAQPETQIGEAGNLEAALLATPPGKKVRVIVSFTGKADARAMAAAFSAPGSAGAGRVLRTYDHFPLLALEVNENALAAIGRARGVVSWMPDVPVPPALGTSLGVINADDVHALGFDGSGLTIAILDTGIDQNHPFFEGRIVSQACYSNHDPNNDQFSLCPSDATSSIAAGSADTGIERCNNNGDLCDHGTHVAGIAAGDGTGVAGAPAAGVAPAANIIAIQVFTRFEDLDDCEPRTAPCVLSYPSDQIAGLNRVFALRNDFEIAAANMSLGGGENDTACDLDGTKVAIDALLGEGIATVIASGNDGWDDSVNSPGCISTAVTVGRTSNDDTVFSGGNRGPLIDLFAPGTGINSAGSNGGFELKSGTSMSAPHVAGAWAVLRQVFPDASVATLLTLLQDTGLDISYTSGTDTVTTPRIDLLAATQTAADPPTLTVANATVTVDEGQTATNGGTYASDAPPVTLSASIGSVVDTGRGAWSWSYPTTDGPAQSQPVTITAADGLAQNGEVTFDLVVENVAPSVAIAIGQVTAIDEGRSVQVTATFTDPGTLDTHTATVACHDVDGGVMIPGTIAITGVDPVVTGTVTATCNYGDASYPAFPVVVSVVDKDGGAGSASFDLTVHNVDPTVAIDTTGATPVHGTPVFIGQIGDPLAFDADVTDPGSDDLDLTWDWDDGSTSTALYLLNPPNADPKPSPDMDPRDVNDSQSHTWYDACLFDVTLAASDDDGGQGHDAVAVVIAGDSGRARSMGYWQTEYRGRTAAFDGATLNCYLSIVGFLSGVFDEVVDASTVSKAAAVLHPRGRPDMAALLDAQLLAAWLNFANGAFGWDDAVDTDDDKVPDTAFSIAVMAAEAVRLDPNATRAQLEAQKDVLASINLMHE